MRQQPNYKLIGLFLITSIFVFVGIVTHFTAHKFSTKEDNLLVMYFDESVSGLSIGSPVVFMGVEIGKVARIDLITNPENLDFRIPVYAKMEPRKNVKMNGFRDRKTALNELIEKGLRARLTTQSYLTGQLMIELEMLPDTKAVLRQEDGDLLEIPTVLSQMGKLSKGIQDLPIRTSVLKFNEVMSRLDNEIIPNLNTLISNINTVLTGNQKEITKTLYNANQTLTDVSMAAKSLRNFADYVERHPESLLKGKKDE